MKRAHIYIEGRVQGVGFRYFTKTNARRHGITGWVKNLPDGRVEAVFEGENEHVKNMIDLVKKGPSTGRVTNLVVRWETPERDFDDFRVAFV